MLRRLSPIARISPLLVGKSSPTASLYFENACADWLKSGNVQKISPTVFASAHAQLVFRHDAGVPVGFWRPKTLYFLDDYWHKDTSLGWQYRLKSKLVEHRAARHFLPRADYVGVASKPLLDLIKREYPNANTGLIHPYWREKPAGLEHFQASGLKICYLGARSHSHDLALIIPAVRAVLQKHPDAEFYISAQHKLPDDLKHHAQVVHLATMGWQEYRAEIVKHRFHIALYPLQATLFNKARSNNKLIEHAIIGAATLCSGLWKTGSDRVISIEGSAESWTKKLLEVSSDKQLLCAVAQANKSAVEHENRPAAQRKIWENLLFPK